MLRLFISSLIFLITYPVALAVDQSCALTAFLYKLKALEEQDDPVEAEVPVTNEVLGILTTADGTVGALFSKQPLPAWLESDMRASLGPATISPAGKTPWDKIPSSLQRRILQHLWKSADDIEFYKQRTILGLEIRPSFQISFPHPAVFLGVQYSAGKPVTVQRDSILENYIEWGTPYDAEGELHLELHSKSKGLEPWGAVLNAWKLQTGLKLPLTSLHQHTTAFINKEQMQREKFIYVAKVMFLYLHVNYMAEFSYIFSGMSIRTQKQSANSIAFSSLNKNDIDTLTDDLMNYVYGRKQQITKRKGFVGFAWDGFFRTPGLWALETRTISPQGDMHIQSRLSSEIKARMLHPNFGYPEGLVESLVEMAFDTYEPLVANATKGLSDNEKITFLLQLTLNTIWYHKLDDNMELTATDDADKSLFDFMLPGVNEAGESVYNLKPEIKKLLTLYNEVEMLITGWENNPLCFYFEGYEYEKILRARRKGVSAILDMAKSLGEPFDRPEVQKAVNKIVKEFLIESDVAYFISSSFNRNTPLFSSDEEMLLEAYGQLPRR